jgi:NADH dehydrogenase FAD-containing subunit
MDSLRFVLAIIDLLGCNTHFVSGDVTELTPTGVHVHGWSAPLPYHYLVIATGSSYAFPGKLALPDRHAAVQLYKDAFEQIKKSRRVVIVGGGPVGIELAGEIDDAFRAANAEDAKAHAHGHGKDKDYKEHDEKKEELPKRTITLIQRNDRLSVNFPVDMARLCESKLVGRGVNVMLNTAANLPAATLELYHTNKVSYVAGHQIIPTSTGVDVECDLLFVCAGYMCIYLISAPVR